MHVERVEDLVCVCVLGVGTCKVWNVFEEEIGNS